MFKWLARQYAKRIVNINVNIIVAGLVAMTLGAVPVHLSRYLGVHDDDHLKIKIIFFVSDWVFDLIVAVGLHWLANHLPRRYKRARAVVEKAEDIVEDAPPPTPFLKDAAMLQLQRGLLSFVLYPAAWLMMTGLLHAGFARELAGIISMIAAILLVRVIHTVWLIRIDRKALEDWNRTKAERMRQHAEERARIEAEAKAKAAKAEASGDHDGHCCDHNHAADGRHAAKREAQHR